MISRKMEEYVKSSSVIRAMFEEGKRLASIHGADNVYDFSLGNPSVAPPEDVKHAIIDVLNNESPTFVHGYMNNSGYDDVRRTIAYSLNRRFKTEFNEKNLIMTVGAAGGLNVILKTILNPDDEVITFAPYFSEYKSYVSNYDGNLIVVSPNTFNFQPNFKEFSEKITAKTKAIIINSPNNPTGVVYSEKTIQELSDILRKKQKEFGTCIYLIADEPYRELAYDDIPVPYIPNYFENTVVCYSYSKSLSLPGERIGYLVIPNTINDFEEILSAANVANRILGFVNAPSLLQRAIAKCVDVKVDLNSYNKNRNALYKGLLEAGFECVKPEGAFYMFVKSPIEDDKEFANIAKKFNILVVPGSAFACPGYIRIAYCVSYETIINSLPKFKELMNEIKSAK